MSSLETIPVINLALTLVPVLVVVAIMYRWAVSGGTALYSIARMLIQLMLVGYVLTFVFEADNPGVVVGVLSVMLLAASWISMRPLSGRNTATYFTVLISISIGGILILLLVTQAVLRLTPWYQPHFVIPLAGMIFANSMNSVSLAAERFAAELKRAASYVEARDRALNAALIPVINSLFAVGLVSFPGMMTGQILSGISPLVAARYQIMVMCMIFGSAGLAAVCYLFLQKSAEASSSS